MRDHSTAETPRTPGKPCSISWRARRLGGGVLLLLSVVAHAQQPPPQPEGTKYGNYNVSQSVEVGWRFDDRAGSSAMYNTLVDLHGGPRVLEQTLDVRSLNHHGLLFDTLSLSSFGYGGDPNAASRLRAQKNRWYNLNASFRRNRNFWDFDLLANPLNPATSQPANPVTSSPHRFDAVRRMSEVSLTLLPQARVRGRLSYGRSLLTGPAMNSVHIGDRNGVELLLLQPWCTSQDNYQAGMDFKLLPRTSVSFDQFITRIKDEQGAADRSFGFVLPNGTPFDLGLVFDTRNFQPCAQPVTNPNTQPPTASANCAGASGFTRAAAYHAINPTEQIGFQSDYFRKFEITGRAMYSSADLRLPSFDETFAGFIPTELRRQTTETATSRARRVSTSADVGATWEPVEKLRVHETFRYAAFRVPGDASVKLASLFAASATAAIIAGCTPPFTPANCPQHAPLSPPDAALETFSHFLGQGSGSNVVELQYDFARWFGARLGHRFRRRTIDTRTLEADDLLFLPLLPRRGMCANQPLQPDGSCRFVGASSTAASVRINENSLLFGAWALVGDRLRANLDLEWTAADNTFLRLDARRRQQVRARVSYRPRDWADLSLFANRGDAVNPQADVNFGQHERGFGATALLARDPRWGVQLVYDWSRTRAHADICYAVTQPAAGAPVCPTDNLLLRAASFDGQSAYFGSAALRLQPIRRVTAAVGYSIARSGGEFLALNPLAVPGSLRSRFARPNASLAIGLARTLTWKAAWGQYRYDEDGAAGPTAARNFRGDVVTLSLRYGF